MFIKNVSKANIISILLMIISTDFIYSSNCCNSCKKNKEINEGGGGEKKKTISKKSNTASRDAGRLNIKDIKGTKNLDKRNPGEEKNKKMEEERKRLAKEQQQRLNEEKKKFEDRMTAIKSNLESFLKNSKNRKKRNYQWNVSYSNDGAVTIKYFNFTGFITKKEIDKIEDAKYDIFTYSDNIIVTVEVKIGIDSTTKHNIKDPTCTLTNLKKSLDSLPDIYRRNDGPEYLCVKDINLDNVYIDLSNSVVYSISDTGYLSKINKTGQSILPGFKNETFYGINNDVSKNQNNALLAFMNANNKNNIYTAEFNIAF